MPFKVAVVNKLSKNVLHKGGNCAGVEAELVFVNLDKILWQYHITDT